MIQHARKVYSQYGEDGIIAAILDRIGDGDRRCAEFGAYDGLDCSNTANLWRNLEWTAVLAEVADDRFDALCATLQADCYTSLPMPGQRDYLFGDGPHHRLVRALHTDVTPDNVNTVLPGEFDVMSADVDGDEYLILEALDVMPRILIVEFNQSVPWWMHVRPAATGGFFGSSAAALVDLLAGRGMDLVEAIGCNLIAVRRDQPVGALYRPPAEILTRWEQRERPLTWLATNYAGVPRMIGGPPPWGIAVDIIEDDEALVFGDTPDWVR